MKIEEMEGQMSLFDQDTWSGKTSPEPCLRPAAKEKGKTSVQSSKKRQGSQTQMPLFLDLRTENGQPQDASWETGGAFLGEFSIFSFGEQPTLMMREYRLNSAHRNGVGESRLSQILTAGVPDKYYLSPTAAQGILRRAETRGKELPEILKKALLNQASVSKNELESQGGGKGILTQIGHTGAIVSGNTQNVVQAYGISAYESNSMKSSNPYSGVYEADTTRTLDNNGGNPSCNQGGMAVVSFDPSFSSYYGGTTFTDVAKTLANGTAPGFHDAVAYESPNTHTHTAFAESGFSKWEQGEQSIPIRASGGCIGGGSETLVAEDSRDPVC